MQDILLPLIFVPIIIYILYDLKKLDDRRKQFILDCQTDNPHLTVFGGLYEDNKLFRVRPLSLSFNGNKLTITNISNSEVTTIDLKNASFKDGDNKEWLEVTLMSDGKVYKFNPFKYRTWNLNMTTALRFIPAREALASLIEKHGAMRI